MKYLIKKPLAKKKITSEDFVRILMDFQKKDLENISLITPDHFAPQIREALQMAKFEGLLLPIAL